MNKISNLIKVWKHHKISKSCISSSFPKLRRILNLKLLNFNRKKLIKWNDELFYYKLQITIEGTFSEQIDLTVPKTLLSTIRVKIIKIIL